MLYRLGGIRSRNTSGDRHRLQFVDLTVYNKDTTMVLYYFCMLYIGSGQDKLNKVRTAADPFITG
jgi:hypothetical protein